MIYDSTSDPAYKEMADTRNCLINLLSLVQNVFSSYYFIAFNYPFLPSYNFLSFDEGGF